MSWLSSIWGSVEGLTSVIAAAHWGMVLALLVALALSVVTMLAGNRRDTLTRLADVARQEEVQQASRLAVEANERAERLEVAAEEARQEREALRSENEALQTAARRERIQRRQLEERLGPRSVSPEHRRTLVALLAASQGSTVNVRALNSTAESSTYAEQIREAFVAAGWHAAPVLYATVAESEALPGLTVVLHDVSNATTLAVRNALGEAGVHATYRSDWRLEADQVLVVVGQKPAPAP